MIFLIRFGDLKKEVIKRLNENFQYKTRSNETKEDIPEKTFFVRMLNHERESLDNLNDFRRYTVEIQFRLDDNNELADIGDQLTDLFYYSFKCEDRYLLILYNEWNIDKNNLFFRFSLEFIEDKNIQRKEYDVMRKLEIIHEEAIYG